MNLLDENKLIIKDPKYGKKILLFDIETSPNLSYVWGRYEQNVIAEKEGWYILCFAYKWLGEKETYVVSLPDFKEYKKNKSNDEALVKKLWKLFDEAEVIIAQNGDAFDIKKSNARFIKHRLEPPSPYKTIDTLKIARRYFKLDSNRLDDLGDYLRVGRKIHTGGFNLWLECINGDKEAWKKMTEYCKQDVILLEKVYYKIRGWSGNHPNMNILFGGAHNCPNCGSLHVVKRGFMYTRISAFQRWKCLNCGAWSRGEKIDKETPLR